MADEGWPAALDGLPGLSVPEKGKARYLLTRTMPREDARVLLSGSPEVAAEAIKEYLRHEGPALPAVKATKGVARLMHGAETVGTVCLLVLVDFVVKRWLALTARHCLDPQPGQPIGDLGLTVCGYELRHICSFPVHDFSVLELVGNPHEDKELRETYIPCVLSSGVGLSQGMQITLTGFPMAVDKDVPGIMRKVGAVSSGIISCIDQSYDLALGDYGGALPNCSGGAVAFLEGPPGCLVGVHLGTSYHEEGQRPDLQKPDVQQRGDQQQQQPEQQLPEQQPEQEPPEQQPPEQQPPEQQPLQQPGDKPVQAVWGAGGDRDLMETDHWSDAPPMSMLASAGKKRRASATASMDAAGKSKSILPVDAKLKYCLENVQHKGYLSCFLPAHTAYRLLKKALEVLERQAGTGQA